jgi:hypothetical protein
MNAAMAAGRGVSAGAGIVSGLGSTLGISGLAGGLGTIAKMGGRIGGAGLAMAGIGTIGAVSTAMDKTSSTRDVIGSVVGDVLAPIAGGIIGSFIPVVGTTVGALIGSGLGQLAKTWIIQTDRTVEAINGVQDELSGGQTDNATPDDQLNVISKIADIYSELKEDRKSVLMQGFKEAIDPKSDAGSDITNKEFKTLQEIAGHLKAIRYDKTNAPSGPRKDGGFDPFMRRF